MVAADSDGAGPPTVTYTNVSNSMRTIYYILILMVLASCSTPDYKICEFETKDVELKLYHDILTELIEQHFYNGYLRQVAGDIENRYPNTTIGFANTSAFKKDLILLQNKLFNDTAKFETIVYRPSLAEGPWKYIYKDTTNFLIFAKVDTTKYIREIRTFLTSFTSDWEAVADTIAKSQTKYTSENFKLCTARVIPGQHFYEGDIGVVAFSKVFMNKDKNQGLLYYEFRCHGKCGKGEIILVQYINERWSVRDIMQLWIS